MSMQLNGMALERRPRALFLAPESPYPLIGGGALRSASVLEFLTQNYNVDLIVFQQPGAADPSSLINHHHIRRVCPIRLPFHSRDPVTKAVRNSLRVLKQRPPLIDRFSGFEAEVCELLRGHRYDLAIIEHFWCAHYVDQLEHHCARVVLDLHNVESVWHQRCAEAEGKIGVPFAPIRMAHEIFRDACLDLERRFLPRFAAVLTTSANDADLVRKIAPETNVSVYPNAVPWVEQPVETEQHTLAFSGSFDYEPNRLAVRYFARQIWPDLRMRWPDLRWRLIGRHAASVTDFVARDPRIECSGPVDDAIRELAAARVVVVPLLSGSGTRLKIIEAWAAGRAVVSTTLGAEGLPAMHGKEILIADEPDAFVDQVSHLLQNPRCRRDLGEAGRRLYEGQLTWSSAWPHLGTALAGTNQR